MRESERKESAPRKSAPTRPNDRPRYMLWDSSVATLEPSVMEGSVLAAGVAAARAREGWSYR